MTIETRLLDALPGHADEIARLTALLCLDAAPVVTVFGKYNHGKSSLLNELIGQPVFEVADRRMTVSLNAYDAGSIQWLDAPGLDADVKANDDQKAERAAWVCSDVRLFVHAIKEGELDSTEMAWLNELRKDDEATGRKTLLILTQIDQVPDPDERAKIYEVLLKQTNNHPHFLVSTTRHQKGKAENKPSLVAHSGIAELHDGIEKSLRSLRATRATETASLIASLDKALRKKERFMQKKCDELVAAQDGRTTVFVQGLNRALDTAISIMRSA